MKSERAEAYINANEMDAAYLVDKDGCGWADGITFPSWCRESVKAYGNAIVPQVALRIFETINDYDNYENG